MFIQLFFKGVGSICLGVLTIKSTNASFHSASTPQRLNLSLSIYEDSSVYYRAGDHFYKNLEPNFVAISKNNKAIVKEVSQNNNIINGKKPTLKQYIFL